LHAAVASEPRHHADAAEGECRGARNARELDDGIAVQSHLVAFSRHVERNGQPVTGVDRALQNRDVEIGVIEHQLHVVEAVAG
jgi:hypothetical protein